ncbi:MAG: NAD(P)-dependent oxidoreductase [Chloroflexota bacterium]
MSANAGGQREQWTVIVPQHPTALPGVGQRFREAGYEVLEAPVAGWHEFARGPRLAELLARADAVISMPGQPLPAEALRLARRARLVTSGVIGVDHIDVAAATELGLLVANCPTTENIVGVAEATIMLTVATLLQLERKQRSLRAGQWRPPLASHLLWKKTVGLVGYGRIARAVETRLRGWDVKVQASDPYVPGTLALDDLLRTSDVVSLHVVLTDETRNMIGRRELALMKPSAVIVNASRGGAIDETALAQAIDAGRIAGAAIDVFEQEPPSMDNPLLRCDPNRVILTPHSIGHNLETGPSGTRMAFENVERALRGSLPESVINPAVIPSWRERLASYAL